MDKQSKVQVKTGEQSADDPFTFVMSSEAKDSDGDIILQDGWDFRRFKRNPIALFGHNHNMIIGQWKNVRVEGKRLLGELKLAAKGTSRIVDEVRSLVEQRILRTVSVGFAPKEYEPMEGGYKLLKNELLECSLVAVPANADAIMRSKGIYISEETKQLVFGKAVKGPANSRGSGVAANTSAISTPHTKVNAMKMGERIIAAEDAIKSLREQVEEIVKGFEDDARDPTEEEEIQIQELELQIESKSRHLKTLKSAEASLGARQDRKATGQPNNDRRGLIPATVGQKDDPTDLFFKMAHCHIRAHREKRALMDVVKDRYGHDPRVEAVAPALTLNKDASTVALTTVSGWAQELTDTATAGFINVLAPTSIYGALSSAGVAIPFGGENAVTMPKRNGTGTVSGSFVGEGNTIPVKQDAYGSVTFNRYKAAVITAFSNEIARVSNPAIEGLLRQAIVLDTGMMLDSVLVNPASTAIAGIRPASPWAGASNQASAGSDLASILTDLRFLFDTLSTANAGRVPRLILNPARLSGLSMLTNANGSFVFRDEIASGRLMGVPFISSTNCPADHVFIIDAADFGTAFGTPEFAVTEQATLVMANDDGTDPTMADTNAISAAGSLHVSDAAGTTPATVVRSMFQTWSTALRMVLPISWGVMRTNTSAYVTGVAW